MVPVWNRGCGPVRRLAPQTRLLVALGVYAVCLLAPGNSSGVAAGAAAVAAWLLACRPSLRLLASGTGVGVAFFLPYLLAVPFAALGRATPPGGEGSGAAAAASIFCRGMAAVWTSLATATTMDESDVGPALGSLHVPPGLSILIRQILHQSGLLLRETRRIAEAMAVRGGGPSGRLPWLAVSSWPRVWLPRVAARADRVAAAMELRGYPECGALGDGGQSMGRQDAVVIMLVCAAVAAVAALRVETPK